MVKRTFIDRKEATTFHLVHRAQNDPLIHDESASKMVFMEVVPANVANKVKRREEMDEEFLETVRSNEGEAANYGILLDDSKYDYMQHLRELGTGDGQSTWIEPKQSKPAGGKPKRGGLEDAIISQFESDSRSIASKSAYTMSSEVSRSMLGDEILPSEFVMPVSYQNQQDVPDEISGFRPDMDPRLREVLEALEDDAYVDDDEDILNALTQDGEAMDMDEWEETYDDMGSDDEGWQSDATIKASNQLAHDGPETEDDRVERETAGWMAEFNKFKKRSKTDKTQDATKGTEDNASIMPPPSAVESALASLPAPIVKGKKRKGALTSTTSYSMTSSSLHRTDALTTLDERYDRLEAMYADNGEIGDDFDDSMSMVSGMTGLTGMTGFSAISGISAYSTASRQTSTASRAIFDGVIDDFIKEKGGAAPKSKKSRGGRGSLEERKVRANKGLEEWDEFRKALGKPLIRNSISSQGQKV